MNGEPTLQRPIGSWLKEADARLDAAFAAALQGRGVDRRGWQVLATLARRVEVVSALASFDEPIVVEGVVDELRSSGLVEEIDGVLRLTPAGARQQAGLAPEVDRVRQQV